MRFTNKAFNSVGIKGIYVIRIYGIIYRKTAVFNRAYFFKAVFAQSVKTEQIFRQFIAVTQSYRFKFLLLKIHAFFRNLAVCKAAGPAVFIISPSFHIKLNRLVHTSLYAVKPVFSHILGFKTAPCMHEKAFYAAFLHKLNLSYKLFLSELIIPAPKGLDFVLAHNINLFKKSCRYYNILFFK